METKRWAYREAARAALKTKRLWRGERAFRRIDRELLAVADLLNRASGQPSDRWPLRAYECAVAVAGARAVERRAAAWEGRSAAEHAAIEQRLRDRVK